MGCCPLVPATELEADAMTDPCKAIQKDSPFRETSRDRSCRSAAGARAL